MSGERGGKAEELGKGKGEVVHDTNSIMYHLPLPFL